MTSGTCPVCGAATRAVRNLGKGFIAAAMSRYVESPVPPGVELSDYEMRRCTKCTLEIAHPAIPAGRELYEWLDAKGRYYVRHRWEWDEVERVVGRHGSVRAVLELGGGDGRFLQRIHERTRARVATIERSPSLVETLRTRGIEAYTSEEAGRALAGQTFNFVLAFHYLEHVPDPVGLCREMCALAGRGGRVLFSVPYSPMFYEGAWYDPLNHPPHHLTRWNGRSLRALANRVGRKAVLSMPQALPLFTRARYALNPQHLGPHWQRQPGRARTLLLWHPWRFLGELSRQVRRERVNGRVAADVVLVELVCDTVEAARAQSRADRSAVTT